MKESSRKTAYRNPIRYEIALVDHKHDLFMRLFLSYVFQDALAERAERISRVQYM